MAKCITEKTLLSLIQLRVDLIEELNNAPVVFVPDLGDSLKVYKNTENPLAHPRDYFYSGCS